MEDLSNINKGVISKAFGQGGGEQIMFGYKIKIYEELGLLREVLQ